VAGLLIRFTGPERWWLLRVAQWSAALPGASVPTPSGFVGATAIAALMAGLAWSVSRLVGRT
jgi:competence protein ComEC